MYDQFRVNVPFSRVINAAQTTNQAASTIYVCTLGYTCTNAGTSFTLRIQDKSSTPIIWLPTTTLAVSTVPVIVLNLLYPIPMIGGLDFITGGTPGSVNVWGNYSQN